MTLQDAHPIARMLILSLLILGGLVGQTLAADRQTGLQASQAVDLAELKTGLRQTGALGIGDKLSLKANLEGLIEDLGSFHKGDRGESLFALKARFSQLFDTTLAKVKAGDPTLFEKLTASRAGLWALFSHPKTFQAALTFGSRTQLVQRAEK